MWSLFNVYKQSLPFQEHIYIHQNLPIRHYPTSVLLWFIITCFFLLLLTLHVNKTNPDTTWLSPAHSCLRWPSTTTVPFPHTLWLWLFRLKKTGSTFWNAVRTPKWKIDTVWPQLIRPAVVVKFTPAAIDKDTAVLTSTTWSHVQLQQNGAVLKKKKTNVLRNNFHLVCLVTTLNKAILVKSCSKILFPFSDCFIWIFERLENAKIRNMSCWSSPNSSVSSWDAMASWTQV